MTGEGSGHAPPERESVRFAAAGALAAVREHPAVAAEAALLETGEDVVCQMFHFPHFYTSLLRALELCS